VGILELFLICMLGYLVLEFFGGLLGWSLLERLPAQWKGIIMLAGAAALLVLEKRKSWGDIAVIGILAIAGVAFLTKWWRERE